MLFSSSVLPSRRPRTLTFLFNQHEALVAPEPTATLSMNSRPPHIPEAIRCRNLSSQHICMVRKKQLQCTQILRQKKKKKKGQHRQKGNDENKLIHTHVLTRTHSLLLRGEDISIVNASLNYAVPVKHQ